MSRAAKNGNPKSADDFLSARVDHWLARIRPVAADLDPVRFSREVLCLRPWSAQRTLMRMVASGARRIAVRTGHGVGKTVAAAALVCWWLVRYRHQGVLIATSAPTNRQVEKQLWREIRRLWSNVPRLRALGTPLVRELRVAPYGLAIGFSTDEPQRFQGWHAPVVRVLIDEAGGFPESLWVAIDSCLSSANAQLVALGNPIEPQGYFYRMFGSPDVTTLHISSRDHPNVVHGRELIPGAVTRQWIADFEAQWSSEPDIIAARIDGEFPLSSPDAIIRQDLLQRAADVEVRTDIPTVLGLDVARWGRNRSVLTRFDGQRFVGQQSWSRMSLMETAAHANAVVCESSASVIVVDDDGVGGGVTDRLRELGAPVLAFRGGLPPEDEEMRLRYRTRSAQAWWTLREMLEQNMLQIRGLSNRCVHQLISRRRRYNRTGRDAVDIESKVEFCSRTGLESPDEADSLVMAVYGLAEQWRNMAAEPSYGGRGWR